MENFSRIFINYLVEFENESLGYVQPKLMLLHQRKTDLYASFLHTSLDPHFSKYHTCEKTEAVMCWRAGHGQIVLKNASLSTKKPVAPAASLVYEKSALRSTNLLEAVMPFE